MSNAGQGILTIVGAVVGSYFGYPQLGFVLGSLAGQALFPTQLPTVNGPRLSDTRTTTSMVGGPVLEVLGVDAVPGTVMWLGRVYETTSTDTTGGKGGPEQDVKTFRYSQPIAIGLCRGPMGGLYQIFENGKLVYDNSPQRDGETDADFVLRGTASAAFQNTFTLYLGDEDQLPDPTIESIEGIGNVPAFRGLMYIVFHNRQLREDQGLRHPNFKFVVYQSGLSACEEVTENTGTQLFPWAQSSQNPLNPLNDHIITLVSSGRGFDVGDCPSAGDYDTVGEALAMMSADKGLDMSNYFGVAGGQASCPGFEVSFTDLMGAPLPRDEFQIHMIYGFTSPARHFAADNIIAAALEGGGPGEFVQIGTNGLVTPGAASSHSTVMYGDESGILPEGWRTQTADGEGRWFLGAYSGSIRIERVPSPPDNPCDHLPPYPGAEGYCFRNGEVIEGTEWTHVFGFARQLQAYSIVSGLTQYPIGPVLTPGDPDDTQEFWESNYAAARALGFMEGGLNYPTDYPAEINQYYTRTFTLCTTVPDGITLDQVVRYICNRCGLTDEQIDVTDLSTTLIRGYVISRIMNGRDAIEPLRLVGYFDVVESGEILKFVKRGKAAVRTLSADELGAVEYGSEPIPAVQTTKQDDTELPRQLRLHYRAWSRDYEEGEQLSPTRLTTNAINDVDIECPIAIDDQLAAEAAEVNWADPWAGRWVHQIQIDRSQLELEPSDCILIPVDGRMERVRILSIDDQLPMVRKLETVRDDDGTYVSVAIAGDPMRPPNLMPVYRATLLTLLDLPPLRDEDDDAGVYAVAVPASAGSWGGARIFRSLDGGGSYTEVAGVAALATTGTLGGALAAGVTTVWDDENTLLVTLSTGVLESRTEAALMTGANTLAIGAHGRWELVQFATAVQLSETSWRLSHLLRGRRGTEHVMGTSQAGDAFVLVSGAAVLRLAIPIASIGQEVRFRAVTNGALTSSATDVLLTSAGVTLRPFSPVPLTAVRELDDDVVLSWLRRDRHGQELQGGSDVPMSEVSLLFRVEIYEVGGATPVRSTDVTAATYTYSAADQTTDLGGLVAFEVQVSQVSAVVGAGPAAVQTFEP
jgi:hypothetical protein